MAHANGGLLPASSHVVPKLSDVPKRRQRKRRYHRVAVRCGCWLFQDGATVFGNTVDLASGGLFLRTALPLPPGTAVDVRLELPGMADAVLATGRIVRHERGEGDARPGLAVHFEHVAQGHSALSMFLGQRKT